MLYLSVPDLELLAMLILNKNYPENLRAMVYSVIFGGQTDEFNFHLVSTVLYFLKLYFFIYCIVSFFFYYLVVLTMKSGFDERTLTSLLQQAGFCDIERVGDFHLFPRDFDSSTVIWLFQTSISLNLIARPCMPTLATDDSHGSISGGSNNNNNNELRIDSYDNFRLEHNAGVFDREYHYGTVPDFNVTSGNGFNLYNILKHCSMY